MAQYIIKDLTENTGKDYIGESGQNCSEEDMAKTFDSFQEAEEYAKELNPNAKWYMIEESKL